MHIEQRERDFWKGEGDLLDPLEEVAFIEHMFQSVQHDIDSSTPDRFLSSATQANSNRNPDLPPSLSRGLSYRASQIENSWRSATVDAERRFTNTRSDLEKQATDTARQMEHRINDTAQRVEERTNDTVHAAEKRMAETSHKAEDHAKDTESKMLQVAENTAEKVLHMLKDRRGPG